MQLVRAGEAAVKEDPARTASASGDGTSDWLLKRRLDPVSGHASHLQLPNNHARADMGTGVLDGITATAGSSIK